MLTTGRPRAGRRFEPVHERELAEDALRAADGLPGARRGLLVLQEMTGPYGIPDFVAAVGDWKVLEARQRLGVPPLLNEIDSGVVAAAAARAPRTVETLAKRVGWSTDTVARRLPELLRSGALLPAGKKSFVRPADLRPIGRLFAIESKVSDWKRALRQARVYSQWCDGYVLVMGTISVSSLTAVSATVSADGGGLMAAGQWLHRPRLRGQNAARRLWGSEYLVAAVADLDLVALRPAVEQVPVE